jgi:hypothetical protein
MAAYNPALPDGNPQLRLQAPSGQANAKNHCGAGTVTSARWACVQTGRCETSSVQLNCAPSQRTRHSHRSPDSACACRHFPRRSSRFAAGSADKKLMPVMFPPGRARLATRPSLTGSLRTGIVVVAALAANAEALFRRRLRTPAGESSQPPAPAVEYLWFSAER